MTCSAVASRADPTSKTDTEWCAQLAPTSPSHQRYCINGVINFFGLTFKPGGT